MSPSWRGVLWLGKFVEGSVELELDRALLELLIEEAKRQR